MKTKLLVALIATASMSAALADAGDILVRARIIDVDPNVSTTSTLTAINTSVKSDTVPELDFTYMFTNNIGAELILGTSRHDVSSNLGDLGKVSVLPPTLTLQYHFSPQETIRPYVGAGINYTRFYNSGLNAGGTKLTIDNNSTGFAAQAGVDIAVNKEWFVNFDVKKIQLKTDVSLNGTGLGTLNINPWVIGVGVGTKF